MTSFILTAQLKLAAPGNVRAIVAQINKQLTGVKVNVNINVTNATKQLNSVSKAAKTATNDMEKFGEQSALAIRRYGAFTLATGAFIKLSQAISSGVSEAIKFDREIVRLGQVTGQSTKSMKDIADEVTRLSKEFGASSTEILHTSVTLAQAGLSAKDTKTALEALAKTSVSATFGDITNTTEAAIAIMQQFGKEAKDLEGILGSINAVSARYAVESEDIAVAVRRAGGAFQAAGGDLNEFQALFTSVRQTTRESAESIATGFRTIFTRLQRTRTQNFLETLGIDVKDVEGQFVGPYKAIQRLSAALQNIKGTDPRFAQIVEELGGFRQISKVIPLITKFEVAQEALNVAIRGGDSLSSDAARSQEALSIQIAKVREEFSALIRTLTNSSAFRGMIDVTLKLTSALIKLVETLEPVLPLIAAFGALKVGQGFGSFSKGFGRKITGFASGGLVPGQGNSDTHPAMLTPGEFVIKKSAVKAIGVENLQHFNTGSTGPVTPNNIFNLSSQSFGGLDKKKQDSILKFFAQNRQAPGAYDIADEDGIITKYKIKSSGFFKSTFPKAAPVAEQKTKRVLKLRDTPSVATIDPRYVGQKPAVEPFSASTAAIASSSGTKGQAIKDALKNYDKVTGDIKIYGLSRGIGESFSKTIEPGLVSLMDKALNSALPNGDGTKFINPDSPPKLENLLTEGAVNSVKGQLFEVLLRRAARTIVSDPKKEDNYDLRTGEADKYARLFGTELPLPAEAKSSVGQKDRVSILSKTLKERIKTGVKFATGGMASGGDTVPAMLTPGEFVVNKDSAKKIGYGNLHRMNRVQKYAKGGVVGNLASAASNPIAIFGILGAIQSFTNALSSGNKEIDRFTTALSTAALSFSAISSAVGGARGSLSSRVANVGFNTAGFDMSFKDLIKSQGGAGARATLRRKAILNGASTAAVGFGSLAVGAGGYLSGIGNERTARGDSSGAALSATGGLLSGAGTGASIGSIFGPWGIAIGAATGGLVGFLMATKDAEKQIRSTSFGKTFDELERKLNNVATGRVAGATISGSVADSIIAANKAINSSESSDERQDLVAKFNQNTSNVEKFFGAVASSSLSLEDFNLKTKNTLSTFSYLSNIPFKDLQDQVQSQIDTQNQLKKQSERLLKVRDEEIKQITLLNALQQALNNSTENINRFSNSIENIQAFLNGGSATFQSADNSALFGAAKGGQLSDTGKFKNVMQALVSPFDGIADSLASQAVDNAQILNKLPDILLQVRNTGAFDEEGGFETKFEKAVRDAFGNISEGSVSSLLSGVRGVIGSEAKDEKILSSISEDVFGVADQIGKALKLPIEVLEKFEPQFKAHTDNLIKTIDLEVSARGSSLQQSVDITRSYQELSNTISKIQGKTVSGTTAIAQRDIRASEFAGSANVGVLTGRRAAAISTISQLTDKERTGAISDNEIDALKAAKLEYQNTANALKELQNSSEALSAIQNELAEAEERRKFKSSFADTIAFGTADEKRGVAGNISRLAFAQKFGANALANFDPNALSQLFQFLKSVPKGQKILGQDAEDIIGNLRNQRLGIVPGVNNNQLIGAANDVAKEGGSSEQQALIEQLKSVVITQAEAANVFATEASTFADKLSKSLSTENDRFLMELRKVFIDNLNNAKLGDIGGLANDKKKVNDSILAGNTLQTIFGVGKLDRNTFSNVLGANTILNERDSLLNEKEQVYNKFSNKFALQGGENIGGLLQRIQNETGFNVDSPMLTGNRNLSGNTRETATLVRQINELVAAEKTRREKDIDTRLGNNTTDAQLNPVSAGLLGKFDKSESFRRRQVLDNAQKSINVFGKQDIDKLNQELERLTRAIEFARTEILPDAPSPFVQRAYGGTVPGRGTGDTVPAMLTPGEFVMRKSAVDAIGLDQLQSMNNMQYFANGGKVQAAEDAKRKRLQGFLSNNVQRLMAFGLSDSQIEKHSSVRGVGTALDRLENPGKIRNSSGKLKTPARAGYAMPGTLTPEEQAAKKAASSQRRSEIRAEANMKRGIDPTDYKNLQTKMAEQNSISLDERKSRAITNKYSAMSGSAAHQEFMFRENQANGLANAKQRLDSMVANRKYPKTREGYEARKADSKVRMEEIRQKALKARGLDGVIPNGQATSRETRITNGYLAKSGAAGHEEFMRREANAAGIQSAKAKFSAFQARKKNAFATGGPVGGGGSTRLEGVEQFNRVVQTFSTDTKKLSESLDKFPREISLSATHKVEVVFNGAEILTKLEPEIQRMAIEQSKAAINNMIESKFPDVGKV